MQTFLRFNFYRPQFLHTEPDKHRNLMLTNATPVSPDMTMYFDSATVKANANHHLILPRCYHRHCAYQLQCVSKIRTCYSPEQSKSFIWEFTHIASHPIASHSLNIPFTISSSEYDPIMSVFIIRIVEKEVANLNRINI